jgi:Spy/CpxP family protein refolding chaperone
MKISLLRASAPALALAFLLAPVALARPGMDSAEHPQKREQHIERKIERKIERLAPKLELDEQATARLMALMKDNAKKRHAAMSELKLEREALRSLVEGKAPEAELARQLDRLRDAMAKLPSKTALIDDARAFLTVEQQAKLVLMSKDGHGMKYGKRGKRGMHGDGEGMRMKKERRDLER